MKKIDKFLNKSISIGETIGFMLLSVVITLGIMCIIISPFSHYQYVTFGNELGKSNKCYKYKDELVCEVRISVQQYSKN